jgi:hypothetical protein
MLSWTTCHGYPVMTIAETVRLVSGENDMSKEKKSNREGKKKALMTPKEKKAAKKHKKETTGLFANNT